MSDSPSSEQPGRKRETDLRLPRAGGSLARPDSGDLGLRNGCLLAAVTEAWERQRRGGGVSGGQLHVSVLPWLWVELSATA